MTRRVVSGDCCRFGVEETRNVAAKTYVKVGTLVSCSYRSTNSICEIP